MVSSKILYLVSFLILAARLTTRISALSPPRNGTVLGVKMHLLTPLLVVAAAAGIAHAQSEIHEYINPTNITGSVPIPGFRMDIPYPGDWSDDYDPASGDGWRLSINLTEEWHPHTTFMGIDYQLLPPPMGAEGALFRPSNVSFNGTNYSQTMPSWAVDNATSDTWSLWFGYPEFERLRTVEEGNNATDGSCPESVVSAECQQEIRDAIKDVHQGYWGELSILTYDQIFEKLEKCDGFAGGTLNGKSRLLQSPPQGSRFLVDNSRKTDRQPLTSVSATQKSHSTKTSD